MECSTVRIQSKMKKLESSLSSLNLEILTTINFLQHLRKIAVSVVNNLSNITTPTAYLQEYLNVNSFIMKYFSFLTEINCKFELLDINSVLSNKMSVMAHCEKNDKEDSDSKSNQVLGNLYVNELSDSNVEKSKRKKLNKNKSNKPEHVHGSKNNKTNDAAKLITFNDDSTSCKSENISTTKVNNAENYLNKTKRNISANTSSKKKSNVKNNIQGPLSPERYGTKAISLKNLSKSEISFSDSTSHIQNTQAYTQNKQEKSKQYFNSGKSYCSVVKSPVKIVPDEVLSSGHQLKEDISLAEITPAEVNDSRYNLKISKKVFSTQELKDDHLKPPNLTEENRNEVDEIEPAKIVRELGTEYDVVIEHIKSPSEFYVSITEVHSTLLSELEKKLRLIPLNKNNVSVKKKDDKKSWLSKEIGTYALVYSKCDETWLRAKITSWGLNFNDDLVHIFLIDCGEYKCVSVDDLKPMPAYIKQYPALSERCHLFNILPIDMDIKSDAILWEKESTEKMKFLTENSNRIRIKIAPNDGYHPTSSLPVTLWLVDKGNQCVNELLVKSKHAVLSSIPNQSAIETEVSENHAMYNKILNDWDPMKEDFESYQNSYDLDMGDPAAFIYGYVGKDHERVCKLFSETGYCFKGDACKKEHKQLDPLGFTTDQEEVYKNAFNTLPVPSPDSVVNVQVTYVLDFNQFFCIPESDGLFNKDEDLHSLLKFMNSDENVRVMKKLLIPPSAGQIVIGRYSVDQVWYRARVIESEPENDKYQVVFVDYGNKETLSLSDVRAIEGKYLHLPFQAMQCYIFGIRRNCEVPLEEVMNYIHDRLDDGHISIEVVARLPGEHVNLLVHVLDHNGRNIAEDLLDKGYAVLKEEMLINPCSKTLPG